MKSLLFLRHILTHRYLALILRLYLGGLFIYASMYKINYSAEFAEVIAGYQILPYWVVNISAVVLPWVELIAGMLLLAGVRSRSAVTVIGALLIAFAVALLVNLLRGASIPCGCFDALGEKISSWTLLRDVIWLGMAVHIFFYDKALHLEERFSLQIKEI